MTPEQRKRFYFPAWNRCARKYDWKMAGGRLVGDLTELRQEVLGWQEQTAAEVMLEVLRYADHCAQQKHRAVTPEDLRHACNFTAAKVMSSEDLGNQQLRRVVDLFDLLVSPLSLKAIRRWENPEEAEHDDLIAQISKLANEGTIKAICRNSQFNQSNWRELSTEGLRWLRRTLLQRSRGGSRRSALRRPVRDLEKEPF